MQLYAVELIQIRKAMRPVAATELIPGARIFSAATHCRHHQHRGAATRHHRQRNSRSRFIYLQSWAIGTWSGSWVNSILTNSSYGNGASGKGVALWDLDNEPTWWDAVHRDVHPNPFTYDEVTNDGLGTALAIKSADPTALVSGPVMDSSVGILLFKEGHRKRLQHRALL